MTAGSGIPRDPSGLDLEHLIARGMRGERLDVIEAMLRTQLLVPSGADVGPGFVGFVPVLYDRDGVPMLAVFTSLERARAVTHLARYAVTMTGRDVVARMPTGHGIVLNPGHDVGLEILPQAIGTITERLRQLAEHDRR